MGFDARVELLEIVNVVRGDLDILQGILPAGSAPECENCGAPIQPPHMHLRPTLCKQLLIVNISSQTSPETDLAVPFDPLSASCYNQPENCNVGLSNIAKIA